MTKFSFDAGGSKVRERHFLYRFFKFVNLLVKNIVNLYMCYYRGTFRTFSIFISANIFRGHDLISCSNGIILCAYEIAFHASDLQNRSHDLLICANDLIFRTNDLIKRAHKIFIHAIDTIIRGHGLIIYAHYIIFRMHEMTIQEHDLLIRFH